MAPQWRLVPTAKQKRWCARPHWPSASTASKTDVDWAFISAREGGQVLKGYVPNATGSQSGVTISTGVDLGQRSESDIDALDIPADLKTKLKPYCGKRSKDATRTI